MFSSIGCHFGILLSLSVVGISAIGVIAVFCFPSVIQFVFRFSVVESVVVLPASSVLSKLQSHLGGHDFLLL